MIRYYRKSIVCLLNKIHEIKDDPFQHITDWFDIQKTILKKILYIEKRITLIKDENVKIKQFRRSPDTRLTKEESIKFKDRIKYLEWLIEEYKWIIKIYKSVGDAVAFTFWDKWDIKPQAFKEDAGFIFGKKSLRKEKQMFTYAFSQGIVAILHDITQSLRYGDLSIVTEKCTR